MKKIIVLIIYTFCIINVNAQNVIGAWERNHISEQGKNLKSIVIFSNGYQAILSLIHI